MPRNLLIWILLALVVTAPSTLLGLLAASGTPTKSALKKPAMWASLLTLVAVASMTTVLLCRERFNIAAVDDGFMVAIALWIVGIVSAIAALAAWGYTVGRLIKKSTVGTGSFNASVEVQQQDDDRSTRSS